MRSRKPADNFFNQAIAQACAFVSPKTGILSDMAIYRQLFLGENTNVYELLFCS